MNQHFIRFLSQTSQRYPTCSDCTSCRSSRSLLPRSPHLSRSVKKPSATSFAQTKRTSRPYHLTHSSPHNLRHSNTYSVCQSPQCSRLPRDQRRHPLHLRRHCRHDREMPGRTHLDDRNLRRLRVHHHAHCERCDDQYLEGKVGAGYQGSRGYLWTERAFHCYVHGRSVDGRR